MRTVNYNARFNKVLNRLLHTILYKNKVYKNDQVQICQFFKNGLRTMNLRVILPKWIFSNICLIITKMYTRIPKKTLNVFWLLSFMSYVGCKVKPLNSGHLCALKKLTVIKRCPLLGRYLKKKVTFRTNCFIWYSSYVCYLGCLQLGGFTVHIISHFLLEVLGCKCS